MLIPCFCTRNRCTPSSAKATSGKNDHVQGVEAGQRVAGDVLAAAGQQQQVIADHRHRRPTIAVPTRVAKNAN